MRRLKKILTPVVKDILDELESDAERAIRKRLTDRMREEMGKHTPDADQPV